MGWEVVFATDFIQEFDAMPLTVKQGLLVQARTLKRIGPELGRPWVDTLNGSRYARMKELRFRAGGGEWRAAFAFDPERKAIILVAANKSGMSEKLFYRRLIKKADARFEAHLNQFEKP